MVQHYNCPNWQCHNGVIKDEKELPAEIAFNPHCRLAGQCGLNTNAPVKIDNQNIFIPIIKTSADGKSMIVRLRSVSDKTETVNLSFHAFKQKSIRKYIADEMQGDDTGTTLKMLPYGIASLIIE